MHPLEAAIPRYIRNVSWSTTGQSEEEKQDSNGHLCSVKVILYKVQQAMKIFIIFKTRTQ